MQKIEIEKLYEETDFSKEEERKKVMNDFIIEVSKTQSRESGEIYMVILNNNLGSGAFGDVYLCSHLNEDFANFKSAKRNYQKNKGNQQNQVLDYQKFKDTQEQLLSSLQQEKIAHYKLSPSNIFKTYDIFQSKNLSQQQNPEQLYYYSIQDFFNCGNLEELINKRQEFKIQWQYQEIVEIISQIIQQCYHLKKHNIIHRDIKPSNIMIHFDFANNNDLLNLNFLYKIIDYQLAIYLEENQTIKPAGSLHFIAPEFLESVMCDQQNYGNSKIDIFSVGMVAACLTIGSMERFTQFAKKFYFTHKADCLKQFISNSKGFDELAELLKQMIEWKSENRMGINDLLKSKLLQSNLNNIEIEDEAQIIDVKTIIKEVNLASKNLPNTSQATFYLNEIKQNKQSPEAKVQIILGLFFTELEKYQTSAYKQCVNDIAQEIKSITQTKLKEKGQQFIDEKYCKVYEFLKYKWNEIDEKLHSQIKEILFDSYIRYQIKQIFANLICSNYVQSLLNELKTKENIPQLQAFLQHYKCLLQFIKYELKATQKSLVTYQLMKYIEKKQTELNNKKFAQNLFGSLDILKSDGNFYLSFKCDKQQSRKIKLEANLQITLDCNEGSDYSISVTKCLLIITKTDLQNINEIARTMDDPNFAIAIYKIIMNIINLKFIMIKLNNQEIIFEYFDEITKADEEIQKYSEICDVKSCSQLIQKKLQNF